MAAFYENITTPWTADKYVRLCSIVTTSVVTTWPVVTSWSLMTMWSDHVVILDVMVSHYGQS